LLDPSFILLAAEPSRSVARHHRCPLLDLRSLFFPFPQGRTALGWCQAPPPLPSVLQLSFGLRLKRPPPFFPPCRLSVSTVKRGWIPLFTGGRGPMLDLFLTRVSSLWSGRPPDLLKLSSFWIDRHHVFTSPFPFLSVPSPPLSC